MSCTQPHEPFLTLLCPHHHLSCTSSKHPGQDRDRYSTNEAAAHVSEWATVEGIVAKAFHFRERKHVSQYRRRRPGPDLHSLDPAGISKSPVLSGIEGKHVKITGRIEMSKGNPEIRINAASRLEVDGVSRPYLARRAAFPFM